MNFRFSITALLTILFISGAVLVLLLKKPLCIDSKIIKKIDRITREGTVTAWSCSAKTSIPYDEKFSQTLGELSRRASYLERLLQGSPVEIIWLEERSKKLHLQDRKIFISEDLLLDDHSLESALLRVLLREKTKEITFAGSLLEGALVDLFLQSLGKNPIPDEEILRWPVVLKMDGNSISDTSVTTFLSGNLIAAWKGLGMTEREAVLSQIPNFLNNLEKIDSEEFDSRAIKNIRVAHEEVNFIVNLFRKYADQIEDQPQKNAWAQLVKNLQTGLREQDFFENDFKIKFDYLIQVEGSLSKAGEKIIYFKQSNPAKKSIAVFDKTNAWLLPSAAPLLLKTISEYSTHNLFLARCKIPTANEIYKLSKITKKLLFVKFCGNLPQLTFVSYFERGYEGFAKNNFSIPFVEIHFPSLLEVWKNKSINPIQLVVNKKWDDPLFRAMGWQAPRWDSDLKFFRAQAVIQGIEGYR